MIRHPILLALAFALSAIGSTAHAGKPCPYNDKLHPEQSRVCKAGTIQVCEDGQWKSLGIKCTPRFGEDDRADAAGVRRMPVEPRLQRDRLVARIAPAS